MTRRVPLSVAVVLLACAPLSANPPETSYIFPAGGQRGTTVNIKVGGVFLHEKCKWDMLGPGIKASTFLTRVPTLWFEGPVLPLPDSQRSEDYPKDMAGTVTLAKDAALGTRWWRVATSQGAAPSRKFVVGDLPEILEEEIDGDPLPVAVALPVTINGRIFPRGDVDFWTIHAKKGQHVRCEVVAARLGSPLDARLEIVDATGKRLAENDDTFGADPVASFTAPADDDYHVRIMDTRFDGGQAFVYRLTLTTGPHVDAVFPLGGPRGGKVSLLAFGRGISDKAHEILLPSQMEKNIFRGLTVGSEQTNNFWLEVDDLPEYVAPPPQPVALPAIFNGRITKAGAIDVWNWTAKKGEVFEFDLRAGRLGSPLDGVLSIRDANGKELARVEAAAGQLDPFLVFNVPTDGVYSVRVQDRLASRGGPRFVYRLRVAIPVPDFKLLLVTDAITVPRGGQTKLKVNIERQGGFKEPIALTLLGLPDGVTAAPLAVAPAQNTVEFVVKADTTARIDAMTCTIEGKTKVETRFAQLPAQRGETPVTTVLVAVAMPTPFKIKGEYDMGFAARGGPHQRKYKIERNGYDGPIEISLADKQVRHLQGVTAPTIVVLAGVSEFAYTVHLPPWMETGRTCRVCVMGVATLKDKDGSEHRVSFSSVQQNEQLVAVVGPGKLALTADRTSLLLSSTKEGVVVLTVTRATGLQGPVSLELVVPPHVRGLKAATVAIPGGKDQGELRIQCTPEFQGPPTMPLVIRATLVHNGLPIVAEVKVDVVPEK